MSDAERKRDQRARDACGMTSLRIDVDVDAARAHLEAHGWLDPDADDAALREALAIFLQEKCVTT